MKLKRATATQSRVCPAPCTHAHAHARTHARMHLSSANALGHMCMQILCCAACILGTPPHRHVLCNRSQHFPLAFENSVCLCMCRYVAYAAPVFVYKAMLLCGINGLCCLCGLCGQCNRYGTSFETIVKLMGHMMPSQRRKPSQRVTGAF